MGMLDGSHPLPSTLSALRIIVWNFAPLTAPSTTQQTYGARPCAASSRASDGTTSTWTVWRSDGNPRETHRSNWYATTSYSIRCPAMWDQDSLPPAITYLKRSLTVLHSDCLG